MLSLVGNPLGNNEPITIESLQQAKKSLFERIDDAKRNPMAVGKKIIWMQELKKCIDSVSDAALAMEASSEEELGQQPWYSIEKLAYRLCISAGETTSRLMDSKRIQVDLAARMNEAGQRELQMLDQLNKAKDPQTMPILHLYHLIGELLPEDKQYLRGISDRLIIEEAYSEAIKSLDTCLQHYPNDRSLLQKKIISLQGIGKYQEALNVVRDYKLTFGAYEEASKPMTRERFQIENMRVDSLIGLKQYREAKETLEQLIRELPKENYLKRKMVATTTTGQLQQCKPEEERFFLERAKKQFSQLEEYADLVWTDRSMEADLNFWFFVLYSNKVAVEDEGIFNRVQKEVHQLIDKEMVSVEAVKEALNKIETILSGEVADFKGQFQRFLQETSSQDVPFSKNIQEAIREARQNSMKMKIYGEENTGKNAGILNKIKVIKALVGYLENQVNFQDSPEKTFLHTIKHSILSSENELALCLKGLQELCHGGFHPFAKQLALAIGTGPKQLTQGVSQEGQVIEVK